MAFLYYIDGNRVDEPILLKPLETQIKYEPAIQGTFVNQETALLWYKETTLVSPMISAFTYLNNLFNVGMCNEAIIEIYDQVSASETFLLHSGVIKVTQIEFDEERINLSTKVQDNSFYSYIFNNKELKVDFRATYTKNKILTDPIDVYTVNFFNGCTGDYNGDITGAYSHGYLIQDVFEFIVRVITDEKVGFFSDYLDGITQIFLFKGQSLLNPITLFPTSVPLFEVSFQDLFNEINAQENLYLYIDSTTPGSPVLRLEEYESRFGASPVYTFNEPLFLNKKVDLSQLYGQVEVGSEVTVDGDTFPVCIYTMNEAISYYGFKKEWFFPLGQCNRNTSLNLVNKWVVSNNVIQDIIVGGADLYIDDYILVECSNVDSVGLTADAHRYDFFGQAVPPYFYNLGLNNYSKLQRHSSKFETTFGNFLGIGGLGFRALLGDDPLQDITYSNSANSPNYTPPPPGLTVDSEFVNETTSGGFDGSNNYSNTLFQYVVPQDGDYSFHERLHIEAASLDGVNNYTVSVIITHFDAAMVVKGGNINPDVITNNGFFFVDVTYVANFVAGDIVKASYNITYDYQSGTPQTVSTIVVIWDSYFECNGTPDGGVSITSGNGSIKRLLYEFDYDINETDWRAIKNNPTGNFTINKLDQVITGWIESMTHNDQTGRTKIRLRSQNNATI